MGSRQLSMLRWWVIACSIILGLILLQSNGFLFPYLLEVDHSKLTIVNLVLFLIVTGFVGWLNQHLVVREKEWLLKHLEPCYFASNACMAIGMAGTLIGFMMMFSDNMSHIDTTNVESVKVVIIQMSRGFSTGVVTTLVGVVTSTILKLQLINLEHGMNGAT